MIIIIIRVVNFTVLANHRVKIKESEKRDNYLDLARDLKKYTMEQEADSDTNFNWCTQKNLQSLAMGLEE